jgi:serine/threonine protein kinase
MGLCAINDDRSKQNRNTQNLNSSTTIETKEETEPNKNLDLGKERIINRLSDRTKFTDINNDYIISERILGKGATGIVREGKDKKENKKYAIKTVWKADIEQNECFKKEINISLELNHETIVKCIDIYEDNTSIDLVLEEITGGDLFDHIIHSEDRKLKENEAIDLLYQMLEGLHYLHDEVGIVHRDIKPENFLLYNDTQTHKNRIKLNAFIIFNLFI